VNFHEEIKLQLVLYLMCQNRREEIGGQVEGKVYVGGQLFWIIIMQTLWKFANGS